MILGVDAFVKRGLFDAEEFANESAVDLWGGASRPLWVRRDTHRGPTRSRIGSAPHAIEPDARMRIEQAYGDAGFAICDLVAAAPGENRPQAEVYADIEYVLTKLHAIYGPEDSAEWLTSHNMGLGARPIQVLLVNGAGAVVTAVEQEIADFWG